MAYKQLFSSLENHLYGYQQVEPYNSELRGRVLIDMPLPLIPGRFIPLMDERLGELSIWIYLRYEGIFTFYKSCGCVGHSTSRCLVDPRISARNIRRRLKVVEEDGLESFMGQQITRFTLIILKAYLIGFDSET